MGADASFNLNNFISNQTNHDFARGYTFYVAFEDSNISVGEKGRYLVKSSTLPAEQIEQTVANWQGNEYKIGTTSTYSDFNVDFNVDVKDTIRKDFLKWKEDIHNVKTNIHGIPTNYMKTITLEHLSHTTGEKILTYKLHLAWPSNVGEITLDYSAKEIATFSVTFAYQWHTTE
jgi:hypothetical protein